MSQENYNLSYLENTYSLERICRTCLTDRGDLRPLYNDQLDEMLMSFTTIQVDTSDGLPTNVCSNCIISISRAYDFKQQAEHSNSMLRQYLYQTTADSLTTNILKPGFDVSTSTVDSNKEEYYPLNQSSQEIKGEKPSNEKLEQNEDYEETVHSESDDTDENEGDSNSKEESGAKIEPKNCDNCPLSFTDEKKYEKHVKIHLKSKDHVCSECGKSFQYKVGLKTHMRSHGIGEKKHKCKHCGKLFYELNDCVIHERKHTGEKPEICEICGKAFADPRSLAKHLKIHKGEKKFQCDVCNKKFIHSYTLTAHKRVHTGEKPFVCNICAHACATSTQLTLHMRTHTQERPYVCSVCSKAFTSKSGLAAHQMTHTGERKYICSICGKGSRTSTDLNSHMRTHTGEKPYECKIPLCTKRYKTNSQLNAHMRTHTEESDQEEETKNNVISEFIVSDAMNSLLESDFKTHFLLSKKYLMILIEELNLESSDYQINFKESKINNDLYNPILLFLWTITHNESFNDISKRFNLKPGQAHRIFINICEKLVKIKEKFIKWPLGDFQYETIKKFREIVTEKDFPDVIGAVDQIHIGIPGCKNDKSYFNEYGYNSIILQAICNSDLEFIDVTVDSPGSSTSAWLGSQIYNKLKTNKSYLPENTYIIADNDFESSDFLLALSNVDENELNEEENIFNKDLVKKLICIKRSFKLLLKHFQRLHFNRFYIIDSCKNVVISACILHNIYLKQEQEID